MKKRPGYGERWLPSVQADRLPEGWPMPSRVPLILRCTATIDGAAYIGRIAPFVKAERPPRVVELDSIPHAVLPVRPRYVNALRSAQTSGDLGELLTQAFDERLLKELWPDVWRDWHNYWARKDLKRQKARGALPAGVSRLYKSESVRHAAPRSTY